MIRSGLSSADPLSKPAMSSTITATNTLTKLLISTAKQFAQKQVKLTQSQVDGSNVCAMVPIELKSEQHCFQIIGQYQQSDSASIDKIKLLNRQFLSCISEWQADKIERQSFDVRDAFDNRNLAAICHQSETFNLLQAAQKSHQLLVLVAQPKISASCPAALQNDLEMELLEEMGNFLQHYYDNDIAPVKFSGNYFKRSITDSDLQQLHTILSPVPTVVLYSTVSDHKFYIHVGIWHLESREVFKFSLIGWNWEEAKDQLQARQQTEIQALRSIRKNIVSVYQLLAAFAIDIYYLHLYPTYNPQLLKLEKYFQKVGLDTAAVQSYLSLLDDLQKKQTLDLSNQPTEIDQVSTGFLPQITKSNSRNNQDDKWHLVDTLTSHSESVYSVSFSPDGQMLASASHDQTIKLWHVDSRKGFRTLTGHLWVYDVAFNHDGKLLASANGDHTVKLWDVDSCLELQTLEAHTGNVAAVVFVPNTQMVISGSWDYTIKIWNTKTGNRIRTLQGHTSLVNCLAVSPDGQTLASGSHDQQVKLWNLKTGQESMTLIGHESSVNTIAFSPNGEMIASASDDRTIKMWSVKTGQVMHTFGSFLSAINSVCFSPDGKLLASAGDDKTIKIWAMDSGETIQTLTGHSDSVYHIVFSPNGQILASSSSDNTIRLWERQGAG
jgi:WD40 repeat protein